MHPPSEPITAGRKGRSLRRAEAGELSTADLLDGVPVQNQAVRLQDWGKSAALYVPMRKRWWNGRPLKWIVPMREEKGFHLDATGREVWGLCDGRRTVEQVIEAFGQKHRIRFHEARQSVLMFMSMLVQRKLMVVLIDKDAPTDAGKEEAQG